MNEKNSVLWGILLVVAITSMVLPLSSNVIAKETSSIKDANIHGNHTLGTWKTKTPLPTPRYALNAEVIDKMIYAVDGRDYTTNTYYNINEVYDIASDTWVTKSPSLDLRCWAASGVINKKLYIVGGYDGMSFLNTVEVYDPANDTWQYKSSMPDTIVECSATVLDNKLYVIGGYDGTGYLNTVYIYDPSTDSWSSGVPMSTARYQPGVATVNGKIYAMGGGTSSSVTNSVEMFDPGTSQWTPKASMITGRAGMAVGVMDNKIYTIAGYDASNIDSTVNEEYNPLTDTWSAVESISTARALPGSAVDGFRMYVMGGCTDSGVSLGNNEVYETIPPLTVTMNVAKSDLYAGEMTTIKIHVSNKTTSDIMGANITFASLSGGSFNPSNGTTDGNGDFTTNFTAPLVTITTTCTVLVTATTTNESGDCSSDITVSPYPMTIIINSDKTSVFSGDPVNITFSAEYNSMPVPNAKIDLLQSDIGGSFNPPTGTTDAAGSFVTEFTTPLINVQEVATITVVITQPGLRGQAYVVICVVPKSLTVSITAAQSTLSPGESTTFSIYANYMVSPVASADVTENVDIGSVVPATGQTDPTGLFQGLYVAPFVTGETKATIDIQVQKAGFTLVSCQAEISIIPAQMTATIQTSTDSVKAGASLTVTVNTKDGTGNVLPGCAVTLVSNGGGSFFPSTGTSDNSGVFAGTFTAPLTVPAETNVIITAAVEKGGYFKTNVSAIVTVLPPSIQLVGVITLDKQMASGQTSDVSLLVDDGSGVTVAGAAVNVLCSMGKVAAASGTTDNTGMFSTTFTAPDVSSVTNCTVTFQFSKSGYYDGTCTFSTIVYPIDSGVDLMISNVVCSKIDAQENDTLTFTAFVYNIGHVAAKNVNVWLYVDSKPVGNYTTIAIFEQSLTYSLTFNWTAKSGKHTIMVSIDPENRIQEADKSNNIYVMTLDVANKGGSTGQASSTENSDQKMAEYISIIAIIFGVIAIALAAFLFGRIGRSGKKTPKPKNSAGNPAQPSGGLQQSPPQLQTPTSEQNSPPPHPPPPPQSPPEQ